MSHWSNSIVINIVLCDYLGLGGWETKVQSLSTINGVLKSILIMGKTLFSFDCWNLIKILDLYK